MLKLKDPMREPAGGWVYHDSDLKMRVRSGTLNNLIQSGRQVRRNNNLPVPENFADIVEDYICRHTAKVFVLDPGSDFLGIVTRNDLLSAVDKLPRNLKDTTEQAACLRKTAICRGCPHNRPTVCITCDGLDQHFSAKLPLVKLYVDPQVHVCQIDCLPGMITIGADPCQLAASMSPRVPYPDNCWKKEVPPCKPPNP